MNKTIILFAILLSITFSQIDTLAKLNIGVISPVGIVGILPSALPADLVTISKSDSKNTEVSSGT